MLVLLIELSDIFDDESNFVISDHTKILQYF